MSDLKRLLDWHKREVAHCALGYSNAKSNRDSRRWLMRLKGHSRTVTVLEDLLREPPLAGWNAIKPPAP